MSIPIIIFGDSGTGKSTSIRTLNPKTTAIVNVLGKRLPFPGNPYKNEEGKASRMFQSDDYNLIKSFIQKVNNSNIETLIIDDFQYLMVSEFMNKAFIRGFDKFTEIGAHAWELLKFCTTLREDLIIYILTHSEIDENGRIIIKTIGKLLNDKVCLAGVYSIILYSFRDKTGYKFMTQNPGHILAKSPIDMFPEFIDNDLQYINNRLKEYGWIETKKSIENINENSEIPNLEQQHNESTTTNI